MSEDKKKQITLAQAEMMRHALGLNYKKKPYRNRYAAQPSSEDFPQWEALVELGLAERGSDIPGGLVYFHVTEEGQRLVMGI